MNTAKIVDNKNISSLMGPSDNMSLTGGELRLLKRIVSKPGNKVRLSAMIGINRNTLRSVLSGMGYSEDTATKIRTFLNSL